MKKLVLISGMIIFSLAAISPCNGKDAAKGLTKVGAISLKILEKRLEDCMAKRNFPEEILHLYGIKRVLGYAIDEKNNDIVLIGKIDNTLPPLYLEDFVIALRNTWLKYAPLQGNTYMYSPPSCSIDPEPKVLGELQQTAEQIFKTSNTEDVQRGLNEWNNVCRQPQKVRVMGIPFDSRFGKVMVEADYYMKRLVDGSVSLEIEKFKSLIDMTLDIVKEDIYNNRQSSIPLQSMNRFWFCPGKNSYVEDKGVSLVKECEVMLSTEEEYLSKKGEVVGSGRPDTLAHKFAVSFTEKYDKIAEKKPIYQELEGLFRFVSLAKLMKQKDALSEAKITLDYLLKQFPIKYTYVEPTLPGIPNVKDFQHKSEYPGGYSILNFWLPSCGGVSINIVINNSDIVKDDTGSLLELKRNALKARPDPEAIYWDFSWHDLVAGVNTQLLINL